MPEPPDLKRDFHGVRRNGGRDYRGISARSTKAEAVICLTSREPADKSSIKGDLLGRNNNRRLSPENLVRFIDGFGINVFGIQKYDTDFSLWHFVSKI